MIAQQAQEAAAKYGGGPKSNKPVEVSYRQFSDTFVYRKRNSSTQQIISLPSIRCVSSNRIQAVLATQLRKRKSEICN